MESQVRILHQNGPTTDMSKIYERVRNDVYTEFSQVSVNLRADSHVVIFDKKLSAAWAVGQLIQKNKNIIFNHSTSVRVTNSGIYKMLLCQINAVGIGGPKPVTLPFSVVLYEDYKIHPTYGQYIGWGCYGHII